MSPGPRGYYGKSTTAAEAGRDLTSKVLTAASAGFQIGTAVLL